MNTPSAHSGEQGKPSDIMRVALEDIASDCKACERTTEDKGERGAWKAIAAIANNALRRARELERKHDQSEPEAYDYREVMSKLSGPLRSIWAVMGPRVPRHWDCGGAAFEWGEALRILRDAANNAPPPSEQAFRVGVDVSPDGVHVTVARDEGGILTMIYSQQHPLPPSEQAGISCGTCEGTGLANVVDQDDGALVIDDCPECGGESRVAHHAPEAQAEGEPVLYAPSDWERELRIDGDVVVGRPSEFVVPLYLRPQPSASETPSAKDAWLPIESAPKRGEAIELCRFAEGRFVWIGIGAWYPSHGKHRPSGWREPSDEDRTSYWDRPTHWRALTLPIAAQRKEGESKKHDGPCWRNSHSDCGC